MVRGRRQIDKRFFLRSSAFFRSYGLSSVKRLDIVMWTEYFGRIEIGETNALHLIDVFILLLIAFVTNMYFSVMPDIR